MKRIDAYDLRNIVVELQKKGVIKKEDMLMRADGRIEWVCNHGVSHTIYSKDNYYIHGCDGCCRIFKEDKK